MTKTIKSWLEARACEQRIIDGELDIHELLGAIAGVPPEALVLVEERNEILVLAAKIKCWWESLADDHRPAYMTMRQFEVMFKNDGVGAWQIGNALRHLGWQSSRRSWKENAPRCRAWVPPVSPPN